MRQVAVGNVGGADEALPAQGIGHPGFEVHPLPREGPLHVGTDPLEGGRAQHVAEVLPAEAFGRQSEPGPVGVVPVDVPGLPIDVGDENRNGVHGEAQGVLGEFVGPDAGTSPEACVAHRLSSSITIFLDRRRHRPRNLLGSAWKRTSAGARIFTRRCPTRSRLPASSVLPVLQDIQVSDLDGRFNRIIPSISKYFSTLHQAAAIAEKEEHHPPPLPFTVPMRSTSTEIPARPLVELVNRKIAVSLPLTNACASPRIRTSAFDTFAESL
jgi:hypothetical protein